MLKIGVLAGNRSFTKKRSTKIATIITIEVLFLKEPLILPFLYHKSATTCQICSYKVSNSEPDLCNCVKTEIIESTGSSQ